MQRYLITGFSGFVSRHFVNYLEQNNISAEIFGVDISNPDFNINEYNIVKVYFEKMDLLNKDHLENVISRFCPDFILHLASFSSVAYSWKDPRKSFYNNTNIFLNLLEQTRILNFPCRILSIGSSEEYGNVSEKDLPLKEDFFLNPVSPYAVARVAQELLSKVYVQGYGMDIVMTRSFNHIGPWQKDIFAISHFAKQIAIIKKYNNGEGTISAGDISIIRDFVDVRDVVRAYYMLFQKGKTGEIYNICSGTGYTLENIIKTLAKIADVKVEIKPDSKYFRPNDNKIIIGSNDKIKKTIGWQPQIIFEKSLEDILHYWELIV